MNAHKTLSTVLLALLVLPSFPLGAWAAEAPARNLYAKPIERMGEGQCHAADINDAGMVVGRIAKVARSVAFSTAARGSEARFYEFGGIYAGISGINSTGQMIGYASDSEGLYAPFFVWADGRVQRAPGGSGVVITGINDLGQYVGVQYQGSRQERLFIGHMDDASVRFIDTPGTVVSPAGISNSGRISGSLGPRVPRPGGDAVLPFITGPNGEGVTVLKMPQAVLSARVTNINELGQMTGTVSYDAGGREQFVADGNTGKVRSLGTLFNRPGGISEAGDINDLGYAVGVSSKGEKFNYIPVTITDPKGVMRDLNRMIVNLPEGVYLSWSPVINNRNQVAAGATDGLCYLVCATPDCSE